MKDTVVAGSLRATDTLFSTTAQFQILRVPTSSNGTTFGPGSNNNLLKSNGTSVYWATLVASDIPTISITDKTNGTLPVTRGGTGVTAIENIQAGKDGDGNTISSTYLKLSGGTLTGDLGIVIGETDKFLNFWYNTNKTAGASWRLGALGSGQNDTNYFIIQSGTSSSSATTWNDVIRIGQNTYDAAFGGNIYPLTNNAKTLGTSSNKWSNVYATTFTGNLAGIATKATQDADGNTITSTYQIKALIGTHNFDINSPTQNIIQIWDDVSGTTPKSILGGNQWLVLTALINNDSYSGQLAISFSNGIAWRGKAGTTTWGNWRKIAFADDTVEVSHGGTGATNAANAQTNLGMFYSLDTATWSSIYSKLSNIPDRHSAFVWVGGSSVMSLLMGNLYESENASGIVTNIGSNSTYRFFLHDGENIYIFDVTNMSATGGTPETTSIIKPDEYMYYLPPVTDPAYSY